MICSPAYEEEDLLLHDLLLRYSPLLFYIDYNRLDWVDKYCRLIDNYVLFLVILLSADSAFLFFLLSAVSGWAFDIKFSSCRLTFRQYAISDIRLFVLMRPSLHTWYVRGVRLRFSMIDHQNRNMFPNMFMKYEQFWTRSRTREHACSQTCSRTRSRTFQERVSLM